MSERDSQITNLDYDYFFKIVLVGNCGVGKSNILSKFTRNEFNLQSKSTIGVEMASRVLEGNDNKLIKAEIWDTAGQEKFKSLMKSYYRSAVGALLIYDITKKNTFQELDNWYQQIKQEGGENCIILLVGNKADMENLRQVSVQEGQLYAENNNMSFIETSAYDGNNIELAFQLIFEEIQDYQQQEDMKVIVRHNQRNSKLQNVEKKQQGNRCC